MGVEDFIYTDIAFGPMHAGEAGQQAFVVVVLFAVAVTELAVDDFGDFRGVLLSQRGLARKQSGTQHRPVFDQLTFCRGGIGCRGASSGLGIYVNPAQHH